MNNLLVSAAIVAGCIFHCFASVSPGLPLRDSVVDNGITWHFSRQVPVGQFVNGEYYVVGPCTVSTVSPRPEKGRNGSVLNIPPNPAKTGFDSRSTNYDSTLRCYPPIPIKPGDALVSTISLDTPTTMKAWLSPDNNTETPMRSASVLTCLAAQESPDAFRPGYCDRSQKIYRASQLHWDKLKNLPRTKSAPKPDEWAAHFQRPWLDVCFFSFDAPKEYMPAYAAEISRAAGIAGLLLNCDYSMEEKRRLLTGFVQYGIDLGGLIRAGFRGWPAWGGHGSGRKWSVLFAGIMLDDTLLQSPQVTYPNLMFGEDMQTMYDSCWTGANVVYAGHRGVINGKAVDSQPGWGPYEHLDPSQWYSNLGESYRRCCTSMPWIGESLAARIMGVEKVWNHDAFFDYVDRWMTENDSGFIAIVKDKKGWDFSASWCRQGQCFDAFVNEMWAKYRKNLAAKIFRKNVIQPGPKQLNFFLNGRSSKYRVFLAKSGDIEINLFDLMGRIRSSMSFYGLSAGSHLFGLGNQPVDYKLNTSQLILVSVRDLNRQNKFSADGRSLVLSAAATR